MDRRISVVADDLTGACEIAGVALRHGIRSSVTLEIPTSPSDCLLVIDSETRLSDATEAAAVLKLIGQHLASGPVGAVFKKTDSVLRGPVLAELETLATELGLERIVLVPANPHLGRIVENGKYLIRGVPLHETTSRSIPIIPRVLPTSAVCSVRREFLR